MSGRLRVALVHPFLLSEVRRGGERYLDDLAWFLAGAGHHVDIIASGRPRGVRDVDGVTVRVRRRIARGWLRDRGVTPAETHGAVAWTGLLRRRYDVVHALVPTAALAGVASGHRTVLTELGHPTTDDLAARPVTARLWRAAHHRSHATTALSASAASAVGALTGRTPQIVAPGVRLDRFTPGGTRHQPPQILFAADAGQPRKGLDLLLAALVEVRSSEPEARVVVAGPGDPSWAFRRLTPEDRGAISSAVDLIGVGDARDLPRRYRDAAVTALPSYNEAFGLVLVESLACGTPAVATALDGMAEILDRPGIGGTFPRGDVSRLADELVAAIRASRNPSTVEHCRERALDFGWAEEAGPSHVDLYRRVSRRNAP